MNNIGNNSSDLRDVGNSSQRKMKCRHFLKNKIKDMPQKERFREQYFQNGSLRNKNKDLGIMLANWKLTDFKINGLENCTELNPF